MQSTTPLPTNVSARILITLAQHRPVKTSYVYHAQILLLPNANHAAFQDVPAAPLAILWTTLQNLVNAQKTAQ